MPIKSIEIICIPCPKCERVKQMIADAVRALEMQNKIKIVYDFKHTPHLKDVANYSVSPSQAPIVIINGNVEFAGTVEQSVVRSKIKALCVS